jgi:hypothetical protein
MEKGNRVRNFSVMKDFTLAVEKKGGRNLGQEAGKI